MVTLFLKQWRHLVARTTKLAGRRNKYVLLTSVHTTKVNAYNYHT